MEKKKPKKNRVCAKTWLIRTQKFLILTKFVEKGMFQAKILGKSAWKQKSKFLFSKKQKASTIALWTR